MQRQKWVDHAFPTNIDVGWTENILSRVRDTNLRLHHYASIRDDDFNSRKLEDAWSIKEHIGHLIDLEALHYHRLQQFAALAHELSPADMSNQRTYAANHNERSTKDLLTSFEDKRSQFLIEFDQLNHESLNHAAFHPRLKVEFRPVDMLFFMAEHDDHHITSIVELLDR